MGTVFGQPDTRRFSPALTIMTTIDNTITNLIFTEKTFNKCKEDFVWFIKTAIADKKSDAYGELFHRLLKIFVDADTNKDGLVSKASFFKMSFDEFLAYCLDNIFKKMLLDD